MIRKLLKNSSEGSLLTGVKNVIAIALWLPLIIILFGLGTGVGFFFYRLGRYGKMPDLTNLFSSLDTTSLLLLLGLFFGIIGVIYLSLASITFGEETVDDSVETIQKIVNESDSGSLDSFVDEKTNGDN